MNKKFFLILLCCFLLSIFLLTACNQSDSSQDVGNGENNPNKPVYFTVLFDTLGGSDVSSVTVEKGHKIGEIAPPTKKCSEFVGFALDVAGDEMWDFTSDVVLSDITLYVIWNEKHSWSDWTETTTPTCTEPGEIKRTCEVCGKFEKKILDNVEPGFREVYRSIDDEFLRVIFLLEREKLGAGVDTLSIVVSTIKTPTKGLSYEETVEFYTELLNKTRNELNLERQKPDFNEREYYKSKVKEAKIENLSFLGFKTLR